MDSSATGAELAEDDEEEDEDEDEDEDDDDDDDVIGKEGTALPARPECAECAEDEDDDCIGRLEAFEDCAVAKVKFRV
jgi:hypothetical protein